MSKNNKCNYNRKISENENIINCSKNVKINKMKGEIARGTFGIIYNAESIIDGKLKDVIVKKIINKSSIKNSFFGNFNEIKEKMDKEVEYSYEMAKYDIGPKIYDSFFYIGSSKFSSNFYQYIIMEKFDSSVHDFINSKKNQNMITKKMCNYISNEMINLVKKQIYEAGMSCLDLKLDNFVIKLNPIKIKMIDFGIDWCTIENFPKIYNKLYRNSSDNDKKNLFYFFSLLQIYMDIIHFGNIHTDNLLIPFYQDEIFNEYIQKKESLDHLNNLMNSRQDQGITLRHYLQENNRQSNLDLSKNVFSTIERKSKKLSIF
jgi:serine/threonine protein kinase